MSSDEKSPTKPAFILFGDQIINMQHIVRAWREHKKGDNPSVCIEVITGYKIVEDFPNLMKARERLEKLFDI